MNSLVLFSALFGLSLASSYPPYMDMADMYRMQLLADAWGVEDYLPEAETQLMDSPVDSRSQVPYWPELDEEDMGDNSIYNDQLYSGPHPRDQEHLEHSALHGFQSVSGGASEVSPNPKQVKTDKALPEYCNPPNPCPVGKTAADNCVEKFENSAENNEHLLRQQQCPCDTEHMFSCPAGSSTVSSKGENSASQQMTLNKVLDDLAKMEEHQENTPNEQTKRFHSVAKKSPHIIHKRSEQSAHGNPYLQGSPLTIAAKKDPNMAKRQIPAWARWNQERDN